MVRITINPQDCLRGYRSIVFMGVRNRRKCDLSTLCGVTGDHKDLPVFSKRPEKDFRHQTVKVPLK